MSPDDKRHGTVAGYRKHFADGEKACRACKDAKNAYNKSRPPQRKDGYIDSGYDPRDGLTGGRWMRDTWGVMRWVETEVDKGVSDVA